MALLPGCWGLASRPQRYCLVAPHDRSAFPPLCSEPPWIARRQSLSAPISALLRATTPLPAHSPAFDWIDAQPWPVCSCLRHGGVPLRREDGAYWGKTSNGWFFGFKRPRRPIDGRLVKVIRRPGPGEERAPALALLAGVERGVTWGDLG